MKKNADNRLRAALLAIFVVMLAAAACSRPDADAPASQASGGPAEPWTATQTVEPANLAKELADSSAPHPTVVGVGFAVLYRNGHVPGAAFHGPASTPEGLADLTRWAQTVPKTTDVVLYCGCCPFAECPNIRPAFNALRDMGFTHLRILLLPHNFGTDWADKGLPVER